MPEHEKEFAVRLKAARELRGLNQLETAERAGLPASAVSHFETGRRKPSFHNLKKLADALKITTDYLLGITNDPAGTPTVTTLYRDIKLLPEEDQELVRKILKVIINQPPRR